MPTDHPALADRLRGIHYALAAVVFALLAVASGQFPDGDGLVVVFGTTCLVSIVGSFLTVRKATVDRHRSSSSSGSTDGPP